jgi:hypothetical protein
MRIHNYNRRAFLFFVLTISITSVGYAETVGEAWARLRGGERSVKLPVFQLPEHNPKLPNVFVYGDSISIAYTLKVREALAEKANVYRFYGNGNHSGRFIPGMTNMHSVMRDQNVDGHWDSKWDVIHLNVGLHDLKHMAGRKLQVEGGKQVNPPEQYEKNLRAIFDFLEETEPDAKIIFGSTTPVPPEGAAGFRPGDATAYNEILKRVLRDYPDVTLNDLYALTKPNPDWYSKPSDVHYGREGRNKQGEQVARAILEALHDKKGN